MRKALILGLAACGMLFSTAAVAQLDNCKNSAELILRQQQNPRPAGTNPLVVCLDDADANKDGRIDQVEWNTVTGGLFETMDEDGDAAVTTEEINRLQRRN